MFYTRTLDIRTLGRIPSLSPLCVFNSCNVHLTDEYNSQTTKATTTTPKKGWEPIKYYLFLEEETEMTAKWSCPKVDGQNRGERRNKKNLLSLGCWHLIHLIVTSSFQLFLDVWKKLLTCIEICFLQWDGAVLFYKTP